MKIPIFDSLMHHYGRTWWAPIVLNDIGPFLTKGERVLDIGAGGGWSGELMAEKKEVDMRLLDIEDFNRSKLPLTLYDGENIPFENNSFDTSLLLFVLHHCSDPLLVLKEAIRISKNRIIIHEDTYTSSFGRALASINDFISNFPFFITNPMKMNMPYNYRTVTDWEGVFQELRLRVVSKRTTSHFMTKHVLFVLEK
ncbi:MAG: class I SAM-dependent methyltransferase [bacterium]|nr:class I SAM-dependent methyltransferase [bacterium]